MKSIYALAAAVLFIFLVGFASLNIGKWMPGGEYRASTVVNAALIMIAFFALGYGAGRYGEKRK
jgi:hypothetical protein